MIAPYDVVILRRMRTIPPLTLQHRPSRNHQIHKSHAIPYVHHALHMLLTILHLTSISKHHKIEEDSRARRLRSEISRDILKSLGYLEGMHPKRKLGVVEIRVVRIIFVVDVEQRVLEDGRLGCVKGNIDAVIF